MKLPATAFRRIFSARPAFRSRDPLPRHRPTLLLIAMMAVAGAAQAANDLIIAPSGGYMTGTELSALLAQHDVVLQSSDGKQTGTGNVIINDTVTWSSNSKLTLTGANNVIISAAITATGASGGLAINPNTTNGGDTASGSGSYQLASTITLSGSRPSLSIGGSAFTVINSLGQAGDATTPPATPTVQGMAASTNLGGKFALGSDIDASATAGWNANKGFSAIGGGTGIFSGYLDGLGHTVSNLAINQSGTDFLGLVARTNNKSVIRNIGLINPAVVGAITVGALVGQNAGTVNGSYVSLGSVSGLSGLGGLVGVNAQSAAISSSFATDSVSFSGGGQPARAGGLVGENDGQLQNCYARGQVGSGVAGKNVGGLVGYMTSTGKVTNCYAAAQVSGNTTSTPLSVGGLVGSGVQGSTVTTSYWDTGVSGQTTSPGGGTPLSTAQMKQQASFTGFDFAATWIIFSGQSYPELQFHYGKSNIIHNLAELQAMQNDLTASYVLGSDIDASASGSGTGFIPVGSQSQPFSGNLDGRGFVIKKLTINQPTGSNVGLFGYIGTGGKISNLGMETVQVTGQDNVGALAGSNAGSIASSYANAVNITAGSAAASGSGAGGLVGINLAGASISNAISTGTLTGTRNEGGLVGINQGSIGSSRSLVSVANASGNIGGLVGQNQNGGSILASYASGQLADVGTTDNVGGLAGINAGSISFANALGLIDCGNGSSCGGLVAGNAGSIANSYASGGVDGQGGNVGGLVAVNQSGGSIATSYATGALQAGSGAVLGGLIGANQNSNSGTLTNTFWNSTLTPAGVGSGSNTGATGLTAAQMLVPANFTGFTWGTQAGATTWLALNINGSPYPGSGSSAAATAPLLADEYSTSIGNAHQLQLMQLGLGASYTVVAPFDTTATGNGRDVWGTSGFVPVGQQGSAFSGSLDGQNLLIRNLHILRTDNNVGLFGYAQNATLSNVVLRDAVVSGANAVGALAGSFIYSSAAHDYAGAYVYGAQTFSSGKGNAIGVMFGISSGTISNCYSTGIAYGGELVGGLVGYSTSTINGSASSANVNARDHYDGVTFAGGLAGQSSGAINNSYASGDVFSVKGAGGLVGNNGGTISDSYAKNTSVAGGNPRLTGGLVSGAAGGSITNSYWDTSSGASASVGGSPLSDAAARLQASFPGWDFTTVWQMSTYPALRNLPVQ